MIKDFWLSLPVKDISKSREFFKKLDFTFNTRYGNSDTSASLLVGEGKMVVMLFEEPVFKGFIDNAITDATKSTEVLLSIGMQNKEQVDEMAQKAIEAGGKTNHVAGPMKGWMYGCVFTDLDGHSWNVMYMDMSKMPS